MRRPSLTAVPKGWVFIFPSNPALVLLRRAHYLATTALFHNPLVARLLVALGWM